MATSVYKPTMNFLHKNNKAFTLIELMISVGLFTIIITISIGAVLQINAAHKKSQDLRAGLDNLNFIMEDMARNIRLGNTYHCNIDDNLLIPVDPLTITPQDCHFDTGSTPYTSIAFKDIAIPDATHTGVTVYRIAHADNLNSGVGEIRKSTNGSSCALVSSSCTVLTPPDINIDIERSGFVVVDAGPGTQNTADGALGDGRQPYVIIRLSGTITHKDVSTPFSIQTTVAQRLIDVSGTYIENNGNNNGNGNGNL